jgi:heme O synthase-like polyprenyltransferase
VPVLPAVMGERLTRSLILMQAAALLPASVALGFFGAFSAWYTGFAALSTVIFVAVCFLCVVKDRSLDTAFRASIIYLLFLFLAIITDVCVFAFPAPGG